MRKLVILLAPLLFATTACWPFSGDDELSSMELEVVSGKVEVVRDAETIAVADRVSLKPGDVIVTRSRAAARLQLAEGRNAQIGSDSRVLVQDTSTLESQQGSLLADASESMTVAFGDARADASDALFRVDRALGSTRAASYRGAVKLRVPGQRLTVESLWQTAVTANDFDAPRPYQLVASDIWDQTYLQEVIDLDEDLTTIAQGLNSQLGNQRPPVSYFGALAKGRNVSFMKSYLHRLGTADLLIGFSLGLEDDEPLQAAVDQAFGLRDQGARWGIAAAIMDVAGRDLVARLDGVIDSTGIASAAPGAAADFTLAAAAVAGELPGSNDPGDGNPDPGDGNDKPGDDPTPPEQCTDAANCAVQEAQDTIDKAKPSPSPSPSLLELPEVP
jgi:hypothetical protein